MQLAMRSLLKAAAVTGRALAWPEMPCGAWSRLIHGFGTVPQLKRHHVSCVAEGGGGCKQGGCLQGWGWRWLIHGPPAVPLKRFCLRWAPWAGGASRAWLAVKG